MAAASTPNPSTCNKLFVAAIDFGTTYSGYAFSAKSEWTKVQTNIWPSSNQMSSKTPTALLLKPDESFHSFGYDAEKAYAELAEEGEDEYKDFYYFHRFKMLLHNCKVGSLKTKVETLNNANTQNLLLKLCNMMNIYKHI